MRGRGNVRETKSISKGILICVPCPPPPARAQVVTTGGGGGSISRTCRPAYAKKRLKAQTWLHFENEAKMAMRSAWGTLPCILKRSNPIKGTRPFASALDMSILTKLLCSNTPSAHTRLAQRLRFGSSSFWPQWASGWLPHTMVRCTRDKESGICTMLRCGYTVCVQTITVCPAKEDPLLQSRQYSVAVQLCRSSSVTWMS